MSLNVLKNGEIDAFGSFFDCVAEGRELAKLRYVQYVFNDIIIVVNPDSIAHDLFEAYLAANMGDVVGPFPKMMNQDEDPFTLFQEL